MMRKFTLKSSSANVLRFLTSRHHISLKESQHRVAIVGSGPSGFYSAKYLLEHDSEIQIDMYEKLPTPFGLVRFGVAPDHPEVKSVGTQFCEVADIKRFRYFGNVKVGDNSTTSDVSVFDLLSSYNAVILASGASSDNDLHIPGESLKGVHSARHFVNWYNGHPEVPLEDNTTFDLSEVRHVVVVGQGNVALDCARILTRDPSELAETDINTSALEVLRRSSVQTVSVVGRRGHVQSAFTIKEFRELTKLRGVRVNVREEDINEGMTTASRAELENNRPKKRITDLIQTVATASRTDKDSSSKLVDFRFLSSPVEFVGTSGDGRVTGLSIQRTRLEGEPHLQRPVVTSDCPRETVPCQLVLKSVGYKCEPLSQMLPFDTCSNTMPHFHGRVRDLSPAGLTTLDTKPYSAVTVKSAQGDAVSVVRGLYVTGWLKRGPSGIIGSNITDARETVASVLADLREGSATQLGPAAPDPSIALLSGVPHVVDWAGFLRIDEEERRRGALSVPPREREKIVDRAEMLRVARGDAR